MTGQELKEIVKNSKVKAKELIDKSGIPEQTYYSLYKKKKVEQHFIDDLKKAGLVIKENITTQNYIKLTESDIKQPPTNPNALQDARLLINIESCKQEKNTLEKEVIHLRALNFTLAESNKKLIELISKLNK